ncbi:hypothetical protein BDN72DRAFT_860618 [Pluteus cervinus]|uniref:Uncharacterized protein n=1 Tax=Pluteus cervinus TaxID=181527 RepID=A0ACD3AIX1_9AGAR|nr:hypothetical protein BDN72DRAFT_860618 [Pluteus cervinus]
MSTPQSDHDHNLPQSNDPLSAPATPNDDPIPPRNDPLSAPATPNDDPIPPRWDAHNLPEAIEGLRSWAMDLCNREGNADLMNETIPTFATHAAELLTDIHNQLAACATIDKVWNSIYQSVVCKVCRAPAKLPVVTGCGHIFCANCLRNDLDRQVFLAIRSLGFPTCSNPGWQMTRIIYAMLPFESHDQLLHFEGSARAMGFTLPNPLSTYTCPDLRCGQILLTTPCHVKVIDDVCRRIHGEADMDTDRMSGFRGLFPI